MKPKLFSCVKRPNGEKCRHAKLGVSLSDLFGRAIPRDRRRMVDVAGHSRGVFRHAQIQRFRDQSGNCEECSQRSPRQAGRSGRVGAKTRRRSGQPAGLCPDAQGQGPVPRDHRADAMGRPLDLRRGARADSGARSRDRRGNRAYGSRDAGGKAAAVEPSPRRARARRRRSDAAAARQNGRSGMRTVTKAGFPAASGLSAFRAGADLWDS